VNTSATTYLVLTVISDDKPGVVELLAHTISQHHGNWLESRMAHLAGKFAGILQVAVAADQQEQLRQALQALSGKGLKIVVEDAVAAEKSACREFHFSVVGNDRPGIVYEIAQAFAGRNINMDELETSYSSMPWSGEPLFEATGIIEVPESVDMDALHDQLDLIADELAVDIRLELPPAH
jgi:glycine cleavage system regulatory protein